VRSVFSPASLSCTFLLKVPNTGLPAVQGQVGHDGEYQFHSADALGRARTDCVGALQLRLGRQENIRPHSRLRSFAAL